MCNARTLTAALAAALLLTACGGGSNKTNTGNTETSGTQVKQLNPMHAAHNAISGRVLNINMGAMNGSKQDGSASITDKNGGVEVTVHLNNEPKGASQPSHIHRGSCKNLDPAPFKPLHNVVDGTATTFVPGISVAELKGGQFAINVHKSLDDLKTYVSCGDLKP